MTLFRGKRRAIRKRLHQPLETRQLLAADAELLAVTDVNETADDSPTRDVERNAVLDDSPSMLH